MKIITTNNEKELLVSHVVCHQHRCQGATPEDSPPQHQDDQCPGTTYVSAGALEHLLVAATC